MYAFPAQPLNPKRGERKGSEETLLHFYYSSLSQYVKIFAAKLQCLKVIMSNVLKSNVDFMTFDLKTLRHKSLR